jgi:hypothetical protein
VIGYGHERCESQLALIGLHEELESSADATFFLDALGEFLVEVLFEIAERMEPIGVLRQARPVEVVLVHKPNENRLAAFSIP